MEGEGWFHGLGALGRCRFGVRVICELRECCCWAFLAHMIFCASCFFTLRSQLIYYCSVFFCFGVWFGFLEDKARHVKGGWLLLIVIPSPSRLILLPKTFLWCFLFFFGTDDVFYLAHYIRHSLSIKGLLICYKQKIKVNLKCLDFS